MNFSKILNYFVAVFTLTFAVFSSAQESSDLKNKQAKMAESVKRLGSMMETTPAYRAEALRLVVDEANRVAQELGLPENLPIKPSNLVSSYISPPRLANMMATFGNVTTSNYTYYCSVGKKFSFLTKTGCGSDYKRLRQEYLWPTNKINTNAAYQLAEEWLSKASMNVKALDRDCNVHIDKYTPEGATGQHFVPVYWVYWVTRGEEGHGSAASVELFEPTKSIRQLRVEQPEYILRKPLEITNSDALLLQTNDSKK